MTSRGIRNNNPGNIDYNGTKWLGLDNPPSDGRFCRFKNAKYGIRAMVVILQNYNKKYNINTIKQIINRWAPPVENNTDAYVMAVSKVVGVQPTDKIDLMDKTVMLRLARAIIQHENGSQPYDTDTIMSAIEIV
jgi:hypothetical protein